MPYSCIRWCFLCVLIFVMCALLPVPKLWWKRFGKLLLPVYEQLCSVLWWDLLLIPAFLISALPDSSKKLVFHCRHWLPFNNFHLLQTVELYLFLCGLIKSLLIFVKTSFLACLLDSVKVHTVCLFSFYPVITRSILSGDVISWYFYWWLMAVWWTVLGTMSASSFDVVCIIDRVQVTDLHLSTILHILRPDGVLWILQLTVPTDADSKPASDSVISALTLGGFVKPCAEVCCWVSKFYIVDKLF